jgi:hypothetical protein
VLFQVISHSQQKSINMTLKSLDLFVISNICEFNGNSKDIYALIRTCKQLLENYSEMPIFLPNELSIFLFEKKLDLMDSKNAFFELAVVEDLDWFLQITKRGVTRRAMNVEIYLSTFIEETVDITMLKRIKQSRSLLQDRIEFVSGYRPLLFLLMKTFRCDISSLFGSLEIKKLSNILSDASYLRSFNKLDNLKAFHQSWQMLLVPS